MPFLGSPRRAHDSAARRDDRNRHHATRLRSTHPTSRKKTLRLHRQARSALNAHIARVLLVSIAVVTWFLLDQVHFPQTVPVSPAHTLSSAPGPPRPGPATATSAPSHTTGRPLRPTAVRPSEFHVNTPPVTAVPSAPLQDRPQQNETKHILPSPERSQTAAAHAERNIPPHMRRVFHGILPQNVSTTYFGGNVTRISFALYRVIKNYRLMSVVDVPCHYNAEWMPLLLERLDWEYAGFSYTCVDASQDLLKVPRDRIRDFGSADYAVSSFLRFENLPSADLLFSFHGLQDWGFRRSWKFFIQARKKNFQFALFTNSQGAFNLPSDLSTVNVRRPPFNFRDPLKLVNGITTNSTPPLQLLLYNLDEIRKDM